MSSTVTRDSPGTDVPPVPAGARPFGRLRVPFLERLAPAVRDRIFEVSREVAARLDGWARDYPAIRRERVLPLALSVAAAAPETSVADLVSTARVSLWVFTLDDRFDEGGLALPELRHRAARYRAVASGRRPRDDDDLSAALREVRADLTRFPLFAPLERQWIGALRGTIDGMLREEEWRLAYRARGPAALPTYESYVANGRYSIGGPPHVWTAIVAVGDPAAPAVASHLGAMEDVASTCIRLANDLQSQAKERREGNVNSLVILGSRLERAGLDPPRALAAAEERVRAEIARGVLRLDELQAQGRTPSGRTEAAVADIARFVCEFYVAHDYHTFAPAVDPAASGGDEGR